MSKAKLLTFLDTVIVGEIQIAQYMGILLAWAMGKETPRSSFST